jgi:hypothetical protein
MNEASGVSSREAVRLKRVGYSLIAVGIAEICIGILFGLSSSGLSSIMIGVGGFALVGLGCLFLRQSRRLN